MLKVNLKQIVNQDININIMKSVIVFYLPVESEKMKLLPSEEDFKKKMSNSFHVLFVYDPARIKIEAEVFFNPFEIENHNQSLSQAEIESLMKSPK